jgi:4'-phosphopantetheinyl transferase EntD
LDRLRTNGIINKVLYKDIHFHCFPWPQKAHEIRCLLEKHSNYLAIHPHLDRCVDINIKMKFLAGRLAAQNGVDTIVEIKNSSLPKNKDGSTSWPDQVVGSISHSKDTSYALVLASKSYQSVGLDVQEFISIERSHYLKSTILTINENRLFAEISNELSFDHFLTLIYSAKESIYKCLYPVHKCFIDFSDIEIDNIDFRQNKLHAKCKTLNSSIDGYFSLSSLKCYTAFTL